MWLLIIWGLRRSSWGFKLALAVYAVACMGTWWGLKAYGERVDWTERGLNPALPGLKPAVVLLAGTFDYQFTGFDTGWHYTGRARFEIRMRGADYYYAERWTGSYWKYNSWDNLAPLTPEAGWSWTRSYAGSGHHGRSGGIGTNQLLVARRLWRGTEFVGATAPDEVRAGPASRSRLVGPAASLRRGTRGSEVASRPVRGFREPYRQSEMSQAEPYYL